jgi:hypothetical protein
MVRQRPRCGGRRGDHAQPIPLAPLGWAALLWAALLSLLGADSFAQERPFLSTPPTDWVAEEALRVLARGLRERAKTHRQGEDWPVTTGTTTPAPVAGEDLRRFFDPEPFGAPFLTRPATRKPPAMIPQEPTVVLSRRG